ncbi:MAG: sigma-70 family RNA polymerase sigma factor, partial [Deltaproteobacteria bacterium]|nr:sigma-70 family RNA polymerase sigma factor [Deltaproteobacteria bacterium]
MSKKSKNKKKTDKKKSDQGIHDDKLDLKDFELLPAVACTGENALAPYNPLQRYILEIRRHRLLTREEERELAIRVREKNDKEAAYILVTSNLRLVVKIAMDFHRYWTNNLLDLIQEGNIGLLQAVKNFDPYRNIKFSYYASFWIKAYILKYIMDNWKLVKIGTTQAQRKLFFNLAKEREKLISEGFVPETKLLAERLGVKENEVVEMSQRLGNWELSLQSPYNDDSDESYENFIQDVKSDTEKEITEKQRDLFLSEKFREFSKSLTGKDADIFENRIMAEKPVTLRELGEK